MQQSSRTLGRRAFLGAVGASATAVVSLPVLSGCGGGGEANCNDMSGVPPEGLATRRSMAYVENSPDPAKRCTGCALYTAAPNQCGTCQAFPGPVSPNGTCNAFAPRA